MSEGRRRKQLAALLRLELRKLLLGRRAIPVYLLALLPVGICTLFVILNLVFKPHPWLSSPNQAAQLFAFMFQAILRGTLYLGVIWISINLFRGEVLDRCLHYYFLLPVRRELLVLGKFVAGFLAAALLFAGSTLATMAVLFSYFGIGAELEYLLHGGGLGQWPVYAGVAALGCLGYGAIFLVVGLFFRNPVIPGLLIFLWELANPWLPALLKKLSVIFYLQSLLPIPLSEGPFALLADPVPAWLALPGLVVFSAAILSIAALKIRHLEIAYGTD